jgi:hypothetical protein
MAEFSMNMVKECVDGDNIFVIRNFCTSEECTAFIAQSEQSGYEDPALAASGGVITDQQVRDNGGAAPNRSYHNACSRGPWQASTSDSASIATTPVRGLPRMSIPAFVGKTVSTAN